jgi:hypothetical protein
MKDCVIQTIYWMLEIIGLFENRNQWFDVGKSKLRLYYKFVL